MNPATREVPSTLNGSFGQMLKYLIEHNFHPTDSEDRERWTQATLAEALGLTDRVQVGRWVRDKYPPPEERIRKMESLFFGRRPNRNDEIRDLFLQKYKRARDSHDRYGNSALFSQSSVLLFWNWIENETEKIDFDSIPIKSKTLDEARWLLETKFLNWDEAKIVQLVRNARSHVFDVKYGSMEMEDDARYSHGIEDWITEFSRLLEEVGVKFDSKLVNVGLGPGLEGREIYDRFTEFVAVDLSSRALTAAQEVFDNLETVQGDAENLPRNAEQCDVYISLKTYSSSFFDVDAAVRSCAQCLRPNGTAIISVPRGYYKGSILVPGIAPTNYDFGFALEGQFYGTPDRILPITISSNIIRSLYKWLFSDVKVHSGIHEFYITARKL